MVENLKNCVNLLPSFAFQNLGRQRAVWHMYNDATFLASNACVAFALRPALSPVSSVTTVLNGYTQTVMVLKTIELKNWNVFHPTSPISAKSAAAMRKRIWTMKVPRSGFTR